MNTEQNHPSQANSSGSAADQLAAEISDQKVDSNPSGNTPEGRTEAQSPPPAVTPGKTQEVHSLKQAAQSEHKPSADGGSAPDGANDCALAGEDPQSPRAADQAKPTKKKRRKKKDNHLSFRCPDEEMDVVEERMESTGETQSEAVRSIIREYGNKTGIVCLSPKTPPEQLEELLGILGKWRRDFVKAQPRLNIPTPKGDPDRYKQVQEWRAKAERLLKAIPHIEKLISAVVDATTTLTRKRVETLRVNIPFLQKARDSHQEKGNDAAVELFTTLLELIDDMGIKLNP